MRTAKDLAFWQADLSDLRRMLEVRPTSDWFGRMGLETRIQEVITTISEIEAEIAHGPQLLIGRAVITFRGRPVIGSRGVEADFGLAATEAFQRAIHRRSTLLAKKNSGNRLPPPPPLAITGVAHGSFGFILEEIEPEGGALLGPTHSAQAIEEVQRTLDIAREGNLEGLKACLDELDGATINGLRDLFAELSGARTEFRMSTETHDTEFGLQAVAAVAQWLETITPVDDTVQLIGELTGVFTISRTFEFVPDGRRVIKGRIADDLDPNALERMLHTKSISTIQIHRTKREGSKRAGNPKFLLRNLEALNTPPSLGLE